MPDTAHPASRAARVTVGVVLVNDAGQVLMQLRDDIPTIADPGCWVSATCRSTSASRRSPSLSGSSGRAATATSRSIRG